MHQLEGKELLQLLLETGKRDFRRGVNGDQGFMVGAKGKAAARQQRVEPLTGPDHGEML